MKHRWMGAAGWTLITSILHGLVSCRDFSPAGDTIDRGGEASGGAADLVAGAGGVAGGTLSEGGGGHAGDGNIGGRTGGAGGDDACRDDADCDDDLACNGSERCELGACSPGTEASCDPPLACREREGEAACEFESRGPWLVFFNLSQVAALGLAAVQAHYAHEEVPPPHDLSLDAIDADYQFVIDRSWSSQGRHLLFNLAGEKRALYAVEFGNGTPSPARGIPNLPVNEGQYQIGPFAPDVDCTLAQERSYLFKICFEGAEPVASLVHDSTEEMFIGGATYCAGAKAALVSSQLFDLQATNAEPVPLPEFAISPDGARLLGPRGDGLELRGCAIDGEVSPVALPALTLGYETIVDWAPDSRRALITTDANGIEFTLIDVDSAARPVLWNATLEDEDESYDASFSPDGEFLLVRDGVTFRLVSVATGEVVDLQLPVGTSYVSWTDAGSTLLIEREPISDAYSAAWWLTTPGNTPQLLFEIEAEDVSVTVSTRARLALVISADAQPIVSKLDLDDLGAGLRRLSTSLPIGPLTDANVAPDASGVLLVRSGSEDEELYWMSLLPASEGVMRLLSRKVSAFGEFQPWP